MSITQLTEENWRYADDGKNVLQSELKLIHYKERLDTELFFKSNTFV